MFEYQCHKKHLYHSNASKSRDLGIKVCINNRKSCNEYAVFNSNHAPSYDGPQLALTKIEYCIFIAHFMVIYAYFYLQFRRFRCIWMIRYFLWHWYSNMYFYTILQVIESIYCIKGDSRGGNNRNSWKNLLFDIEDLRFGRFIKK